jgi:hypothetical protein
MAALEEISKIEENLRTMDETMYVSKNRELQKIVLSMDKDPNDALLSLITTQNWHALDGYFREMSGVDNFFNNLQQLLIFKYKLSIPRKLFQIAMGIQQMVWMTDTENCLILQLDKSKFMKHIPKTQLMIWEEIPEPEKEIILSELIRRISPRYRDGILTSEFMNGTVWYIVENIIGNMWSGFGSIQNYYPIPETLNFTRIANIYVPELVFGILGDISLTEHIARKSRRPYVANLPTKGICEVHGIQYYICNVWIHDFSHTSGDGGKKKNNESELYEIIPYKHWLREHPEYKTTANFNRGEKTLTGEDLNAIKAIRKARGINDNGSLWQPVIPVDGGKKRASRRRALRRSIVASRTSRRVASHLSVRKTRNNTFVLR